MTKRKAPIRHRVKSHVRGHGQSLQIKRQNTRVVKTKVKNSELIDVMQEITSKGARIARTAADVIATAKGKGSERYDVEDEWR